MLAYLSNLVVPTLSTYIGRLVHTCIVADADLDIEIDGSSSWRSTDAGLRSYHGMADDARQTICRAVICAKERMPIDDEFLVDDADQLHLDSFYSFQ